MRRFALTGPARTARRVLTAALVLTSVVAGSRPAHAQVGASTPAPLPAVGFTAQPFALRADWLQANSALTRTTLPSNAVSLAYEGKYFGANVGFLRVVRELSTVEGGTFGVEVGLRAGRFRASLGATAMIGVAMASMDTAGYNYAGSGGVVGHTPRWDYSSTSAKGGGGTLTLEYDFFDHLGLRLTGGSWSFTGDALGTEKTRTTAGVGLTIPFGFGLTPAGRLP